MYRLAGAALTALILTPLQLHAQVQPAAISAAIAAAAGAAGLDPAAAVFADPSKLQWRSRPGIDDVVLYGDPAKPGPYIVMAKWAPGNMSRPHFHPNDRMIMVLKGTWWVGTGSKYEPASTVPMRAGTFVTQYGKQPHYDGAKDEEAVILLFGDGPATTTMLPQ